MPCGGKVSLYYFSVPWLSLKPVVREIADALEAQTRWSTRVLSLFAYCRTLTVHRSMQQLTLVVRRWWLLREIHVLPFSRIDYLHYGYGTFPLDAGYVLQGAATSNQWGAVVINEIDWFYISLQLRDRPSPLLLFRFLGEGGLVSEAAVLLPPLSAIGGWLLRLVILEGDEESRSLELVRALLRLLEVPLSSPMEQSVQQALHADLVPCPECRRAVQRHAQHCVYCGASFPRGAADTVSD